MEFTTLTALAESVRLLSKAPNTPFFYKPAVEGVLGEIKRLGLSAESIAVDEFALYLRIQRGNPCHRIAIVSHLDHPGFAIRSPNLAYPLGSVGWERLSAGYLIEKPMQLRLYSRDGAFVGVAQIVGVDRRVPALVIRSSEMETNHQGMWDIAQLRVSGDDIHMLSADNTICTVAVLAALARIARETSVANIDLTLILTFVEEVFQLSASGIALRGCTPFFRFDQNTLVINLEAMEVECTPGQRQTIGQLGLDPPDYGSGILVKVNDLGVVYGQYFSDAPNLAEELLLGVAEDLKVAHQHTITSGATDATAFSVFPTTRHIATLVIPCVNKHNWGRGGTAPVAEVVRAADVQNAAGLLFRAFEAVSERELTVTGRGLSRVLCRMNSLTSRGSLRQIRRDRLRVLGSMGQRLTLGKFFPETWKEQIGFAVAKVCSRAQFEISKLGEGE